MKAQKLLLTAGLTASMFGMWSCSSDDGWGAVDDKAPTMALATEHYKGAVGRQIPIKATITDADGIAKINLKCSELFLNKTIDIIDIYGEPKKEYNLDFKFPVASDEKGDNFKIDVTVTDVVGNETKQTLTVTMDGDFEAPVFTAAPGPEVTVIMKARTSYTVNVSCSDDQNLSTLLVKWEGLPYAQESIESVSMSGKSGSFSKKYTLPNEEASYKLTLTVIDKEGKKTVKESVINVSSNVPNYPNLWLADVETADELNSDIFGLPQFVDRKLTAEGDSVDYTYIARYYNAAAGTKIRFLAQKDDFGPVCYGRDKDNADLLSDDEDTMVPITLDQAGVYYEITFNIKDYSMSTRTYSLAEAKAAIRVDRYNQNYMDKWENPDLSNAYPFQFGYLNSGPSNIVAFTQDKANPNLFYFETPMVFDQDNNLSEKDGVYRTNFIIHYWHPDGWWDCVCYKPNSSEDPEFWPWWGNKKQIHVITEDWQDWPGYQKVRNSGDKWCKVVVPTNKFGKYNLWFDAHLQRAKLVPAK